MHRREFLRSSAKIGIGLLSAAALPPVSARAQDRDAVEITLEAKPYAFMPQPGVKFQGLAYNGQLPGPLIRVREGQTLRARFRNRTGRPGTVHWHGMVLPNAMDGVEDVIGTPTPQGGEFTYAFKVNPPGFRWYHSHPAIEHALGLYGALIVDGAKDEPADLEIVAVLHDMPSMKSFMAAMQGESSAPMIGPKDAPEMRMDMSGTNHGGMAGMNHGAHDMANMPGMDHSKMSGMNHDMAGMDKHGMGDEVAFVARCINGASYPAGKPTVVKVGQRVRLRVLNASPNLTHYVRLGGHRLTISHSDGNPLPAPVDFDVLRIGPGERYDASFEVTKPGAWLLQAIASDGMAAQQAARLHTPGMERAKPTRAPMTLGDADVFSYERAGDALALHDPGPVAVRQDLVLTGGKFGDPKWMINGRVWPDTLKIRVRRGDRVLIRIKNETEMDHPMHLHGHVFDLVEVGGKSLVKPLQKDTALVAANGGTTTWTFTANSPPGRWLLHCHNTVHMMGGMMTEVVYG